MYRKNPQNVVTNMDRFQAQGTDYLRFVGALLVIVVVFPQSQCHYENVPGRTGIIHLHNCTLGIYRCDFISW